PQWKNHKAVYSQDGSGSWSTINDIDRWETRIKSLKSKDGKPVIDSDSEYNIKTQQWLRKEKYLYSKYGKNNQDLVEEAHLSAYGKLIDRRTFFSDGIDRRYTPNYDKSGREISGKGEKLDPLSHDWKPEFDYRNYRWNKGELTRERVEKRRGNRVVTETEYAEGLPKSEVDFVNKLYNAKEEEIGTVARIISLSAYKEGCPLIASRGNTLIKVTIGKEVYYINFTASELVSFENNRITLKLTDLLRGSLAWHERRRMQERNRMESSWIEIAGIKKETTFEFNGKKTQSGSLFSFEDFADLSYVDIAYPDKTQDKRYKESRALDYNPATGDLTMEITNKPSHLVWLEKKDKYDQLVRITEGTFRKNKEELLPEEKKYSPYEGLLGKGYFVPQEERILEYKGVLGAINMPTRATVDPKSILNYPSDGILKLGGESWPVDILSGGALDMNTIDMKKVFDNKGRNRFQGYNRYQDRSGNIGVVHYQEVKNKYGNPEEILNFYFDKNNKPVLISNLYLLYEFARTQGEELYGQFDIPQWSSRLVFDSQNNKYIQAIANCAHLNKNTGDLSFSVKKGLEINRNPDGSYALMLRNDITYDWLEAHRKNLSGFFTVVTYNEIQDNRGRPFLRLDGYQHIDPKTNFGSGDPLSIGFITNPHSPFIPFGLESYKFDWDKEKGNNSDKYRTKSWFFGLTEIKEQSTFERFGDEVLVYKLDSWLKERMNTDREKLSFDGRKESIVQLGVAWNGYDTTSRLDEFEMVKKTEFPDSPKNDIFGSIERWASGKSKLDFMGKDRSGKSLPAVNLIFEGKPGLLISVEIYNEEEMATLLSVLQGRIGASKIDKARSLYLLPSNISSREALSEVSKAAENAVFFINGVQVATVNDKKINFLRDEDTFKYLGFWSEKKEYIKENNIFKRYSESPWMVISSLPFIAIFITAVVLAWRILKSVSKELKKAYSKPRGNGETKKGIKNYIRESFTKLAAKKVFGILKIAVLITIPVAILAGVLYLDSIWGSAIKSALPFSIGQGFISVYSFVFKTGLIWVFVKLAGIIVVLYAGYWVVKFFKNAYRNHQDNKNLNTASREQLSKVIKDTETVDKILKYKVLNNGLNIFNKGKLKQLLKVYLRQQLKFDEEKSEAIAKLVIKEKANIDKRLKAYLKHHLKFDKETDEEKSETIANITKLIIQEKANIYDQLKAYLKNHLDIKEDESKSIVSLIKKDKLTILENKYEDLGKMPCMQSLKPDEFVSYIQGLQEDAEQTKDNSSNKSETSSSPVFTDTVFISIVYNIGSFVFVNIFNIIIGIGLFFFIWRVFFPMKWYIVGLTKSSGNTYGENRRTRSFNRLVNIGRPAVKDLIKAVAGRSFMIKIFGDSLYYDWAKKDSIQALIRIGVPAVPVLWELLHNKNKDICQAAAFVISKLAVYEDELMLLKLLEHPVCPSRIFAIRSAGEITAFLKDNPTIGKEISLALIRDLEAKNCDNRYTIFYALVKIASFLENDSIVTEAIIPALRKVFFNATSVKILEKLGWFPQNLEEKARYLVIKRDWNTLLQIGQAIFPFVINALKDHLSTYVPGTAEDVYNSAKQLEDLSLIRAFLREEYSIVYQIGANALSMFISRENERKLFGSLINELIGGKKDAFLSSGMIESLVGYIRSLEYSGMPLEFSLTKLLPELFRLLDINKEEERKIFIDALKVGLNLANSKIRPCNPLHLGIPIAWKIAEANVERFQHNLQILEQITRRWYEWEGLTRIRWSSMDASPKVFIDFLNKVGDYLLRQKFSTEEVDRFLGLFFPNIEIREKRETVEEEIWKKVRDAWVDYCPGKGDDWDLTIYTHTYVYNIVEIAAAFESAKSKFQSTTSSPVAKSRLDSSLPEGLIIRELLLTGLITVADVNKQMKLIIELRFKEFIQGLLEQKESFASWQLRQIVDIQRLPEVMKKLLEGRLRKTITPDDLKDIKKEVELLESQVKKLESQYKESVSYLIEEENSAITLQLKQLKKIQMQLSAILGLLEKLEKRKVISRDIEIIQASLLELKSQLDQIEITYIKYVHKLLEEKKTIIIQQLKHFQEAKTIFKELQHLEEFKYEQVIKFLRESLFNKGVIILETFNSLENGLQKLNKVDAFVLDRLIKALVTKAQDELLNKQNEVDFFAELEKIPPTSEVILLRYLHNKGLITFADIQGIKEKDTVSFKENNGIRHYKFMLAVEELLKEKVVRIAFDDFFGKFFAGEGTQDILTSTKREELLTTVSNHVRDLLFKSPEAIKGAKEDINLNVVNHILKPTTLRELVAFKFLQYPFTATKGHTAGMASFFHTFLSFQARLIVKGLYDTQYEQFGKTEADRSTNILKYLKATNSLWRAIFKFDPENRNNEYGRFLSVSTCPADEKAPYELSEIFLDEDLWMFYWFATGENADIKNPEEMVKRFPNTVIKLNELVKSHGVEIEDDDFIIKMNVVWQAIAANNEFNDLYALMTIFKKENIEKLENRIPEIKGHIGKKGFKEFYKRIHSWLFHPFAYFGIKTWGHKTALFGLMVAFLVLRAIILPFDIYTLSAPLSVVSLLMVVVLPFLILGKAEHSGTKLTFIGIFTADLMLWGVLLHLILAGPISKAIVWAGVGSIISLLILLLVSIPTLMFFWHATTAYRGYLSYYNDLRMNTFRRYLSPFRVFIPGRKLARFDNLLKEQYAELREYESKYGPILPNGQTVYRYLYGLVERFWREGGMSNTERDLWQKALRQEEGGRFVLPGVKAVEENLFWNFYSLSLKNPRTDTFTRIQGVTTLVLSAGERFSMSFENTAPLGTFQQVDREEVIEKEKVKVKVETSLGGYFGRNYKNGWANLIEVMKRYIKERSGLADEAQKKMYQAIDNELGKIDEGDDLFEKFNRLPCSEEIKFSLSQIYEEWIDETYPSNYSLNKSMGNEIISWHLTLASEIDQEYFESVEEVSLQYKSLEVAYRQLSEPSPEPRSEKQKIFVERYPIYKKRIDNQHRFIFHERMYWEILVKSGGKIKSFAPIDVFNMVLGETTGEAAEQLRKATSSRRIPKEVFDSSELLDLLIEKHVFKNDDKDSNLVIWNVYTEKALAEILSKIKALTKNEEEYVLNIWAKYPNNWQEYPGSLFDQYKDLSPKEWAKAFLFWRSKNLFSAIQAAKNNISLMKALDGLYQVAKMIETTTDFGVELSHFDKEEAFMPIKNSAVAANLHRVFGRVSLHDSYVRVSPGQEVWTPMAATYLGHNPQCVALLSPMRIPGKEGLFPTTSGYAVGQERFTGPVQAAWKKYLTFYGKGMGDESLISLVYTPGEDSAAVLLDIQADPSCETSHNKSRRMDWLRPVFSKTVTTTEMRYGYNSARFYLDPSLYAYNLDKNIGYDKKLVNYFFWMHYFITPFALVIAILLAPFVPLTVYASLPLIAFTFESLVAMSMITVNNLVGHTIDTGNIWKGLGRTLRDIVRYFPLWVPLFPIWMIGLRNASNERYAFIRTVKEILLEVSTKYERYRVEMFFGTSLTLLGIFTFSLSIIQFVAFGSLFGPFVMLVYFLTLLAYAGGLTSFSAYWDKNGKNLRGFSWKAWFKIVWDFVNKFIDEFIEVKLKAREKKLEQEREYMYSTPDYKAEPAFQKTLRVAKEEDRLIQAPVENVNIGTVNDSHAVNGINVVRVCELPWLWEGTMPFKAKDGKTYRHRWVQRTFLDIANNTIYIADAAYALKEIRDLLLKYEAFKLYHWRLKAMELAGIKGKEWDKLSAQQQAKALKELLKWQYNSFDETNEFYLREIESRIFEKDGLYYRINEAWEKIVENTTKDLNELLKVNLKRWIIEDEKVKKALIKELDFKVKDKDNEPEEIYQAVMEELYLRNDKKRLDSIEEIINHVRIKDATLEYDKNDETKRDIKKAEPDEIGQIMNGLGENKEAYNDLRDEFYKFVFAGSRALWFMFGGSATRLGLGKPMYFVSILSLICDLINIDIKSKAGLSLSSTEETVKKAFEGSAKITQIMEATIEELKRKLKDYGYVKEDKDGLLELTVEEDGGMGINQLISYALRLKEMVDDYNGRHKDTLYDYKTVLKNQYIILHLNMEILGRVTDDVIDHEFYGFDPKKVLILSSETIIGHRLVKKINAADGKRIIEWEIEVDQNTPNLTVGHGQAKEMLDEPGKVYTFKKVSPKEWKLDPDKKETSLRAILKDEKVEMLTTSRVNEAKRWGTDVLNIDRVLYAYYKFIKQKDNKPDIIVEVMDNPQKTKGGTFVSLEERGMRKFMSQGSKAALEGFGFLVEGLGIKADWIKELLNDVERHAWEYNAFAIDFNLSVPAKDAEKIRLPRYLKVKLSSLFTDAVFGDVTQNLELSTLACRRAGDKNKDFKETKDVLIGLEFMEKLVERCEKFLEDSGVKMDDDNIRAEARKEVFKKVINILTQETSSSP
ncbi:MAG: hypothetical protein ABIE75_03435, partial [Candidatus Omnitrophota bacterium]